MVTTSSTCRVPSLSALRTTICPEGGACGDVTLPASPLPVEADHRALHRAEPAVYGVLAVQLGRLLLDHPGLIQPVPAARPDPRRQPFRVEGYPDAEVVGGPQDAAA